MKRPPTLIEKLSYRFDNFMARGFGALILALGGVSLLLIVVSAGVVVIFGIAPEGEIGYSFLEAFWVSLMRTLDAGTMGGDKGWSFRLAMFFVTLGGILIISTFIGLISGAIEEKVEQLRRGRSRVLERGHFIIFGWSPAIFTIIRELTIALESSRTSCILVFSPLDKVEMEEEIHKRIENSRRTLIICRQGDPTDPDDLVLANIENSRAIVILSPENEHPDPEVIKSLLAVTQSKGKRREPFHIVAEIRDPKNREVAKDISPGEIEVVMPADLLARIIAQSCRSSGLSVVFSELLGFDGDEIYFQEFPQWVGRSFGETLNFFSQSCVVGLMPKGGIPKLNPPMDTVVQPGDRIIAITHDITTLLPRNGPLPALNFSPPQAVTPSPGTHEKTLILGFNHQVPAVIQHLDGYIGAGSTISVIADNDSFTVKLAEVGGKIQRGKLVTRVADTTDRRVLEEVVVGGFHRIILMGYTDDMSLQQADSTTLITLLHLRSIEKKLGVHLTIVTEMVDQRNRLLADVAHADDYIVSSHLISMLLAQVAFTKEILPIFDDIFDPEGSEIYLKLARNYCLIGEPVNFYFITDSARKKGEIAIGYRIREFRHDPNKNYGVVINPPKEALLTFAEWDRIIVISEDEVGR